MEKRAMQHFAPQHAPSRTSAERMGLLCVVVLLFWISGCGGNVTSNATSSTSATAPKQGPQTYFAPLVAGTTNGASGSTPVALTALQTYAIDDTADKFSQTIYPLAPQVINAGVTNVLPRGLLSLGITANYSSTAGGPYVPTTYTPPPPSQTGSFAVELAGQAGGLVQLVGQPVAPLVAATQCPTLTTPQTYQFLTIPAALVTSGSAGQSLDPVWEPTTDTAYGSVDISSSGSTVTFNNIHQFTLPSVGGPGTPAQQTASPAMGVCGPTFFGNTISIPGQLVATNPGNGESIPPQATVGIGPSGLLVEDDAFLDGQYQTALGAGTGAVGLPKPSAALDTGAVVGAQYLGFVYGAGIYVKGVASTGWTSHLASFGFSSVPSSCASVAVGTGSLIYGGDFTHDDPSSGTNGFGNCDLAIDLGVQDASSNGLYPNAVVWIGAGYAANPTKTTYSLPAVAIAGQLNGKYAVFLLGVDATQPWAIYLLQSN
jgi:hypothetical protein